MISWFYAYVEHIEIKTKTVNIIYFPYLDLSQNVKIRDVPYSLKSPRNSERKLAHIYGMNKGTGTWGMDFVSSSPLFSTIPPFFKFSYKSFLFQNFHNHSFFDIVK